jgi:hypothetical protein
MNMVGTASGTRKSAPWKVASLCSAFVLVATLALSGCTDGGRDRVTGLEAVPAGYALEITATTSHGARVESLIIPGAGLFRIELLGRQATGMLITVRTPETQLGYRAQTILEGKPHPVEMAFLESPLTYPGPYRLKNLSWEGDACTATLKEDAPGAKPGSYEARIDQQTGLVTWERQEWDDYRGTIEIVRRLVPTASVSLPSVADVTAYARLDWANTLAKAGTSAFPVYGLDIPGLCLHALSVSEELAGVSYTTESQPGRIAAELQQYPEAEALKWPTELRQGWQEGWSDDHKVPGRGRMIMVGERGIYVRVYDWALEELGLTVEDVEDALVPVGPNDGSTLPEPPHLVFEDLMPLPQGADFAETLPLALLR